MHQRVARRGFFLGLVCVLSPSASALEEGAGSLLVGPAWTRTTGTTTNAVAAGDVDGDGFVDMLFGLRGFDSAPHTDSGKLELYRGSANGFEETPSWTFLGANDRAKLGTSPATAGDVNGDGYDDVIVGEPGYDGAGMDRGRAHVFLGGPSGLSLAPDWTVEGAVDSADLGTSVSGAGDVNGDGYDDVLVGAPGHSLGRAFVYLGSSIGLEPTPIWAAGENFQGSFGTSVSGGGDVNRDGFADILVGAPFHGPFQPGAAALYLGSRAGPSTTADWSTLGVDGSDRYGIRVSFAGDVNGDGYADFTVLASGYEFTLGAISVFHGSPAGPPLLPSTFIFGQESLAQLSTTKPADINGDGLSDLIIRGRAGQHHVHLGTPNGVPDLPDGTVVLGNGSSGLIAPIGDTNGDGRGDLLHSFSGGGALTGSVELWTGSAAGVRTEIDALVADGQPLSEFGSAVASAGDVDGDGYEDFLVGAPEYGNDLADEGAAFLYRGLATGAESTYSWMAEGDRLDANFGAALAGVGDIDGDGYEDVAVGAPRFSNDKFLEGRVDVFYGGPGGLGTTAGWSLEGNQAFSLFGAALSTAGDVNRDGYLDLIVGQPEYRQDDKGLALIFLGAPKGLETIASWAVEGDQPNALFGTAVNGGGDADADGYCDVLVGAPGYSNGEAGEGRAYLYRGLPNGVSTTPAWTAEGDQADALFGFAVAAAGDVNGDGCNDVLIGAPNFETGGALNEGAAFVYLGIPDALTSSPVWSAIGNDTGAFFGWSVAHAGDLNGDGHDDIVCGARFFNAQSTADGAGFAYLGNAGVGRLITRQMRVGSDVPIPVRGRSDRHHAFRLSVESTFDPTPWAWLSNEPVNGWLEIEVKPLRDPLDGTDLRVTAPADLTTRPTFDVLVSGLQPNEFYRWRVRMRTDHPLYPVTAWTSAPGYGHEEIKLRTGPLPWDATGGQAGRTPTQRD